MIIVSGNTNNIIYYTRYTQIDKYEILDHETRIVNSGLTTIVGYNGKINHTGLTYNFSDNNVYSYKSYYLYEGTYYLATHQFLQSYANDDRLNQFNQMEKSVEESRFKPYKK